MSNFKIIQTDNPLQYREQIRSFWAKYLTDTPGARFEWMSKGNPDGTTIWFLAIEEDTGQLIGTISIMPRNVFFKDKVIRAGFLGDYIVDKNYRVFGPGLRLPKDIAKNFSELGFDIIFTIPNAAAVMVIQRAGLKNVKELNCYVKPIKLKRYLAKYVPSLLATKFSPVIEICLNIYYREFLTSSKYVFKEIDRIDESLDIFWDEIKKIHTNMLGNHTSEYLKWRYLQNPLNRFRILTARNGTGLVGYLVFTVGKSNGKMEVFDILVLKEQIADSLIKKLIQIAKKEKCRTIYYTVPLMSKWPDKLRAYGFLDAKSGMQLCWLADNDISMDDWDFFQGDRNI